MIFLNPIQFIIVSIIHENLAAFESTITGGHLIKNRISPTHVILAKNNIGPTICVRNCLVVNKCTAVNYIRAERRCELLNDISSINTLQEKDGCDYTEMASWQMSDDPCYPYPCKGMTKCVTINPEKHICVNIGICPPGWDEKFGHCYLFTEEKKTWHKAKEACVAVDNNLVKPESSEENAWIESQIREKSLLYAWIGGIDIHGNGSWFWLDGSPVNGFIPWGQDEPSGDGPCLSYLSYNSWNDRGCDDHLAGYVCEKFK